MSEGVGEVVASVRGLSHGYGEGFCLRLDQLEIRRGEHTAVIGPSGCGKTTLLRILTGVLQPASGEVACCGQRLGTLSDNATRTLRLRRVGMVFQTFALLDYLSCLDNILLPQRLLGGGRAAHEAVGRARSLAERAGVAALLHRRPGRVSQGERQRVAVCRALIGSPDLIICDEPTGNLDQERSRQVVDQVFDEAARCGATVIVATHDRSLLPRFGRVLDLGAA